MDFNANMWVRGRKGGREEAKSAERLKLIGSKSQQPTTLTVCEHGYVSCPLALLPAHHQTPMALCLPKARRQGQRVGEE